jgi:hypothetical protein
MVQEWLARPDFVGLDAEGNPVFRDVLGAPLTEAEIAEVRAHYGPRVPLSPFLFTRTNYEALRGLPPGSGDAARAEEFNRSAFFVARAEASSEAEFQRGLALGLSSAQLGRGVVAPQVAAPQAGDSFSAFMASEQLPGGLALPQVAAPQAGDSFSAFVASGRAPGGAGVSEGEEDLDAVAVDMGYDSWADWESSVSWAEQREASARGLPWQEPAPAETAMDLAVREDAVVAAMGARG